MDKLKPVYRLQNGKTLNRIEFIRYIENKVFKTIRKYDMLELDDKIICAVSGGKDSITALYLLRKYLKRKGREKNLRALAIDEGIEGYRSPTLDFLRKFCEKHEIELEIKSYKEIFGSTQDMNVKILKEKKLNISACNICGTYRRQALNLTAREMGADKLATGHNLDDEAQNILLNIFKNNFKILARLGPVNGIIRDEHFVPRIKPLYFCTEKEIKLYTILMGFNIGFDECPYSRGTFRDDLSDIINRLEDSHIGIKNSVINFYLEMQDVLRKKYGEEFGTKISFCEKCFEPSQKKICNTCELKEIILQE